MKNLDKSIEESYGHDIASRVGKALFSVPTNVWMTECHRLTGWRESLQKRALYIIREHGIENFEELCYETARKIDAGKHEVELDDSWDHHTTYAGGTYIMYHRKNLEEATIYLRKNGIDVNGTNLNFLGVL